MADPTPPSIDYSYAGFQQENQDFPFPGTQIDNDLANLVAAANDTIEALKDIRRADGKLQNGIVTYDAIAPGLAEAIATVVLNADDIVTVANVAPEVVIVAGVAGGLAPIAAISDEITDVAGVAGYIPAVAAVAPQIASSPANAAAAAASKDAAAASETAAAASAGAALASKNAAAVSETNAAASATAAAAAATSVLTGATSDETVDDTDELIYKTGTTIKRASLSGLISSIFKTTRTIANAEFAADTFRLFNAAPTPRSLKFNIDALTTGRTVTVPDAGVDLGRVNNLLGHDQTWQDVSGSRVVNTAYQNTTGRPIMVNITWSTASGVDLQVSANGSTWVTVGRSSNSAGTSPSAVVPPGHYYRVNGTVSINIWSELR